MYEFLERLPYSRFVYCRLHVIWIVPFTWSVTATRNQQLPLPHDYIWATTWQDQDQDSLLVKRRNDNDSPGPVIRELVPSSHQRSELSNTILCIFSGWDQRIGEGIPIPDSLGKEATFINIWNAIECCFLQRLVLGIRSSVDTLALPFKTFM